MYEGLYVKAKFYINDTVEPITTRRTQGKSALQILAQGASQKLLDLFRILMNVN